MNSRSGQRQQQDPAGPGLEIVAGKHRLAADAADGKQRPCLKEPVGRNRQTASDKRRAQRPAHSG